MTTHTITAGFMPRDIHQRKDRFWPMPRQYPTLLKPRTRNS